jgi:hypothetical protein
MAWRWRDLSVGLYVPLLEFNLTGLRFFAGYAAKKWPPFGAAEASFKS